MSELSIPTPHINAPKDAFAKTVLMPGDPHRAKYIAETYFKNPVLINDIRGVQGYTGEYKGKKVSVMASGMGIPSMAIYSYELFHAYNVDNIIRIGTCGGLTKDINIKDILIATGASTDSNYGSSFNLKGTVSAIPSFKLLKKADEIINKLGFKDKAHFGQVLTSDIFYGDMSNYLEWAKMGVVGVEMETYGLYLNAARAGKHALAMYQASENLIRNESITAEEREKTLNDMIICALEIAISLD